MSEQASLADTVRFLLKSINETRKIGKPLLVLVALGEVLMENEVAQEAKLRVSTITAKQLRVIYLEVDGQLFDVVGNEGSQAILAHATRPYYATVPPAHQLREMCNTYALGNDELFALNPKERKEKSELKTHLAFKLMELACPAVLELPLTGTLPG